MHPDNIFGMDVFSLDVQRNRDHGIRFYTKYREYCGLKPIKNEQDLSQIMMEGVSLKVFELLNHFTLITLFLYIIIYSQLINCWPNTNIGRI